MKHIINDSAFPLFGRPRSIHAPVESVRAVVMFGIRLEPIPDAVLEFDDRLHVARHEDQIAVQIRRADPTDALGEKNRSF